MSQAVVKRAYHRLILPDGATVEMAVVEFDPQGNVLSWHKMLGEEPFTQWVGGQFELSNP